MTPARRPFLSLRVLLAATAGAVSLAACGGGTPTGVATGPPQSAGPDTTPQPTATAQPTPTPTAQPTPSPTPTPTATPAAVPCPVPATDNDGACKVAETLYPSSGGACGSTTGHYDACPVTGRLAARLDGNPTPHAEPLCRCQNFWQQASWSVAQTPDPTVWAVHVVLGFGPGVTVKIDVRVLRTGGGWAGDDTTCTGHGTETSIYGLHPPPCPG